MRPRFQKWRKPGEPFYSLHTPEWTAWRERVAALEEPARSHFATFFNALERGWEIIRPLQLAAEAAMFGEAPADDVSLFVYGEVTDNFKWLALATLEMIPDPVGPEPPTDELDTELEMIARNVRLVGMMEQDRRFPALMRGVPEAAADAFTRWTAEVLLLAVPVIDCVEVRWTERYGAP